jgi:hypothetical protein
MARNLYKRGEIWWVSTRRAGRRVRVSTHSRDLSVALVVRDGLLAAFAEQSSDADWAQYSPATHQQLITWMTKARHRAASRDTKRGRVAAFSAAEGAALVERSGGKCEITGIAFSMDKAPGTFRRPLAPSIDRIDNALPYSASNCRLVCLCVNIAINEWGIALFRRVCKAYFAHENGKKVVNETATEVPRGTVSP